MAKAMNAPHVVHTFRLQVSIIDMLREHIDLFISFNILFRIWRVIVHVDLLRITALGVPYLRLIHFPFHFYVCIRTLKSIVQIDLLGITTSVASFLDLIYLYLHLYICVH